MKDDDMEAGDWIINNPAEGMSTSYSTEAALLIEVTDSHLVVLGIDTMRRSILLRSLYPCWKLATEQQIKATWEKSLKCTHLRDGDLPDRNVLENKVRAGEF
jgi:hypothetical protein